MLLNVSGPLEAGDSHGFYTMLKIMKTHGTIATQHLAEDISKKMPNDITGSTIDDLDMKGLW